MVYSHCPIPSPSPLPTTSPTTMDLMVICRTVHTEPTPILTQTLTQMQLGFIPILSADNCTDNVRNNGFKTISTVLWLCFVIYTIKISSAKCRAIVVFQHFKLEEKILHRRRLLLFYVFLQVNHISREIWVHPLNEDRASKGEFFQSVL